MKYQILFSEENKEKMSSVGLAQGVTVDSNRVGVVLIFHYHLVINILQLIVCEMKKNVIW